MAVTGSSLIRAGAEMLEYAATGDALPMEAVTTVIKGQDVCLAGSENLRYDARVDPAAPFSGICISTEDSRM